MAKILIVDDEVQSIKIGEASLQKNGHEVIWAYNGQEGLDKAKSEMPDVIVLDLIMPIMDGYTMLKELRTEEQISHIPVMLCSTKLLPEIEAISHKVGADGCVKKPFDPALFLQKVESLLYR